MKKTITLLLLMLTFVGSAYGATGTAGALTSGTVSFDGFGLYGGVDAASAAIAPSPLVRFSSKVNGFPVYSITEYSLAAKHQTGNKVFGTSNDATQIYWKQSTAGELVSTGTMTTGCDLSTTKFVGNGWTAY